MDKKKYRYKIVTEKGDTVAFFRTKQGALNTLKYFKERYFDDLEIVDLRSKWEQIKNDQRKKK